MNKMLLKRRVYYQRMFSKLQSIRLLKKDERVKKVINQSNKLIIHTHLVKLKPKSWRMKRINIAPLGEYEIIINQRSEKLYNDMEKIGIKKRLQIDINRIGGPISIPFCSFASALFHSPHINEEWADKICWGNAESDVQTTMKNNDWFWTAKLALDLVHDNNPEHGSTRLYKWSVVLLQLKQAIQSGNKNTEKRIRRIMKKYVRFKRAYNDSWLNLFMKEL